MVTWKSGVGVDGGEEPMRLFSHLSSDPTGSPAWGLLILGLFHRTFPSLPTVVSHLKLFPAALLGFLNGIALPFSPLGGVVV